MSREMKNSGIEWIGEIPKEWKVKRIKTIFRERTELSENGDETLLSVSEYYGVANRKEKIEVGEHVTRAESLIGYKKCFKGDLVSNIMLAWKGSLGVTDTDGIVSPAYCVYKPSSQIFPKYYHYLFRTSLYTSIFRLYSKGIIDSRLRLYSPFFFAISTLSPSFSEQQRIADYLDKVCGEIDDMIALQEKMIEELKAYKQSVITEAVTKGLNPNVPMRDSGIDWIGDIPADWRVNKVFRLFERIGSGTTPSSFEDDAFKGSINWIQSGDLNGGILRECKHKISKEILARYSALSVYKAPFIIVAMYGASVGNISISEIDGCVNQACCALCEPLVDNTYAFYAIMAAQRYLIYRAVGGGQPNISQNTLKQLWIVEPPLSEQRNIASFLDRKCSELDSLITIKQKKIEELKDYKKSMIYEYVTGKKQVN